MSATQKTPYHIIRGQPEPASTIIAVGGGKGGIGKSFVSSGLAIFLSNLGHDTHLIDLDLGGSNLHTCIGENLPKIGIHEFLTDSSLSLADVSASTAIPHLKLIGGSSDGLEAADVNEYQRSRLMSSVYKLKSKFIVLDLAAGTHQSTLDFFAMATRKVVVFTPEPSSIENAYRFMKASFYRKVRRFETQLNLREPIAELMSNRSSSNVRSPSDLLRILRERDPINGLALQKLMDEMCLDIVVNQARTLRDADLGPSIQGVCNKYFGIPCNYLGHLDYDNAVWQSLRKRRHLLTEYPNSRVYAQLMKMARRLVTPQAARAMIL